MTVLHTQYSIAQRNCALRFSTDADAEFVSRTIEAWNQRFTECFPGSGFFTNEPEIELSSDNEEIVACNAYYLHADKKFWKAIENSRSFTVDEPVLAVVNA